MYCIIGNSEDVESLINTFSIHGTAIPEANLSSLSSSDLEHFAELSQTLNMSSDMENQGIFFISSICDYI